MIMCDLFSDANAIFLTDRPLLVKLTTEKLEQEAGLLKVKSWKWVVISLEASAIHNSGFARIFPINRVATEAEQAELSSLGEQFDEIAVRRDGYIEGDLAIEADEAALYEIEQQIESIRNAAKVYDLKEKALAGSIVNIGNGGTLQIEMGLVRADDLAALRRLRQPETVGQDGEGASMGGPPALSGNDNDYEKPTRYSTVLVKELTAWSAPRFAGHVG
jgi:ParB family chromosome partitioning protein